MSTSDYIPGLTLACGLVGTLVAVTATWAKDLGASAQRIRILDEATKRALFWDTWSKALANADPEANAADLRSKVKIEIAAAAQSVEEVYHKPATRQPSAHVAVSQYQEHRSSLSRIRRWFLLYKPPRWRAWVPRLFFYIYVLEASLAPFAPFVRRGGYMGFPDRLVMFLGSVLAALVFRWLSIWAERPRALGQTG
jgi:hypothetical protein